ncbi:MAG: hypothetical protein N3G76_03115 [Candidatus Micrarchaeota archaeon]|nr:hypothetical protein [Candidatus Micrarchaeota archaeon]
MVKMSEWRPQLEDYKPSVATPRIPLCDGSKSTSPPGWALQVKEKSVNLSFYENMCYKMYKDKEWYNKILKGGWPGVKGVVRLGVPLINRFGEVIVISLKKDLYPEVRVLGKV